MNFRFCGRPPFVVYLLFLPFLFFFVPGFVCCFEERRGGFKRFFQTTGCKQIKNNLRKQFISDQKNDGKDGTTTRHRMSQSAGTRVGQTTDCWVIVGKEQTQPQRVVGVRRTARSTDAKMARLSQRGLRS